MSLVIVSGRTLLARAHRPPGCTVPVAGWLGRAAWFGAMPPVRGRCRIVFLDLNGGFLIKAVHELRRRQVLREVFTRCAARGIAEARELYPAPGASRRRLSFSIDRADLALRAAAWDAGRISAAAAARAGIPRRYWGGVRR